VETTIEIAGREIPVRISPHPRARRISMRLARDADAVRITVPAGIPPRQGLAFALSRRDWILGQLERRPAAVPFAPGARIPFRSEMHVVEHLPRRRGVVWREKTDGLPRLCVAGAREHLSRRLADWLKRQAREELVRACDKYSKIMGLSYRRISVRDQKSRWGSCSSRGNLNFSWRLIFAPPHVLDYLAAHEVAHLAEMNHSDRFWELVRRHCPDVDAAETWLRRHGRTLHRWGTEG